MARRGFLIVGISGVILTIICLVIVIICGKLPGGVPGAIVLGIITASLITVGGIGFILKEYKRQAARQRR